MKKIIGVYRNQNIHWVGDGFPVKNLMSYDRLGQAISPFLLLDYAAPYHFSPTNEQLGVGSHPHRGFETVTLAYQGEVSHKDSSGGGGQIKAGDVQWMTAGRGIMHEEFHSPAFGQRGGPFSMVQLWVNLPSAHKLTEPKYQTLKRDDLPIVNLTDNENGNEIGKAAIIAGEWQDTMGAASTFTTINLWDIALHSAGSTTLQVPNSHNVMILVQEGALLINDTTVSAGSLIQFATPTSTTIDSINEQVATQVSDSIELTYPKLSASKLTDDEQAPSTVKLLLLSGEPIGEPVAGYGPFVMNTQEELRQTFRDYQTGNFGK